MGADSSRDYRRAAPLADSPTSCPSGTESKKHCHRRVAEHELNRASQQQQLRRLESRFSTHYRKLNLPQRCPAVPKYPELLSALSKRNLAQQRSWDGLIEKMRRAGIDINTDWQEGERVLNNVNLKANSERNGAFSGDSSTNSKSFEGKVHLHRSSLSDSKDVAKVRQKSETTKDKEKKKNCLLLHHSALIAGASARQLKQSWHRVPSIRKINQLSCQAGSKWWKVIQAFRLQRY